MMYDCGVLLSEDGQFGRPDYRDHNSPLSLHSFYMIEWATFGVLCMALLTNPDAEKKIHGVCVSRVRVRVRVLIGKMGIYTQYSVWGHWPVITAIHQFCNHYSGACSHSWKFARLL